MKKYELVDELMGVEFGSKLFLLIQNICFVNEICFIEYILLVLKIIEVYFSLYL